MGFVGRLERDIARLEKNVEKGHGMIEKLRVKCESHKITEGEFNVKKRHVEEKIRSMGSRMRVLQGGIAKGKRHLEGKADEKRRKKEKKAEKKEEAKRREKKFLEHT